MIGQIPATPADDLDLDVAQDGIDRSEFLRLAAALGLLPAAGVLLGAGGSTSARGGTLRLGLTTFPVGNMDPPFRATEADAAAAYTVFQGLVARPAGTQLKNVLADKIERSPDGRRVAFTLKEGVLFQRGFGEVTARDVKFSFERIAGISKPKISSAYASDWAGLQRVRITGKYAGVIEFSQPFAPLFYSTLPCPPAASGLIVSEKAVTKLGKAFGTSPVGSGPYEVTSFSPTSVVLKRFEDFRPSATGSVTPWFDEIHLTFYANTQAVKQALASGALDYVSLTPDAVAGFSASRYAIRGVQSFSIDYISMNVTDPVLRDIRVRRAIRWAIDVPAILKGAYEGRATRDNALIPRRMGIGYWPDAPKYNRDVDKARALLSAANVQNLSLSLAASNTPPGPNVAQIVQGSLKEAGIDVSIDLIDPGTWAAIFGPKYRKLQLSYQHNTTQPDPFFSMVWFTCGHLYNVMQWCNPEFTKLNSKAAKSLSLAERTKMYIRMQKIWDGASNVIWITHPKEWFVGSKSVRPGISYNANFLPAEFREV